jgi:aryl-alcohol dehydrogenase-like predicted oxidoreductase
MLRPALKLWMLTPTPAATFLDTANIYKLGTSEKIIGDYISNHDRDYFVLATKYTLKDNLPTPTPAATTAKT